MFCDRYSLAQIVDAYHRIGWRPCIGTWLAHLDGQAYCCPSVALAIDVDPHFPALIRAAERLYRPSDGTFICTPTALLSEALDVPEQEIVDFWDTLDRLMLRMGDTATTPLRLRVFCRRLIDELDPTPFDELVGFDSAISLAE